MSFRTADRKHNVKKSASTKLFEVNSPTTKYRSERPHNHFSLLKQVSTDNHVNKAKPQNLKIISGNDSDFAPVILTKEMFHDLYSMGVTNLSSLDQPHCLKGTTFFKAPEAYNEIARLHAVEKYINLPQWNKTRRFATLMKRMKNMFNVSGAAISLIDSRSQICKFEVGYGFKECTRQISIDSHTILSSQYLAVLDASKDWRFKCNPLVKDIPAIRYYVGVPLLTKENHAIGVLSIFDRNIRGGINEETVTVLQKMSQEVMEYLDTVQKSNTNINKKSSRLLQTTAVVTTETDEFTDSGNYKKMLGIYGRATGGVLDDNSSVYERDGSGSSYNHSTNFKFTKYSLPYEDLIDLSVWKELSRCTSFSNASNKLCELLRQKLGCDCVYIINIKVTKVCWIDAELFPKSQRVINISEFEHSDAIEWEEDDTSIDDGLGTSKTNINAISCDDNVVEQTIASNLWGLEHHNRVMRSDYGLQYHSRDKDPIYQSGFSLPFYKYGNKLIRKQRSNKALKSQNMELFFRSNGYIISCFNTNEKAISEFEHGYVYGCASILRKIFFS